MTASAHLLVVDHDRASRALLSNLFGQNGFRVSVAANLAGMWRALDAAATIDLLVLDGTLPGKDGPDLCRRLRARAGASIIMLTATNEETDRVLALEMGADDCLGNPFSPRELAARVNALLRRSRPVEPPAGVVLGFEGWRLDMGLRRLHAPDGTPVQLSAGAFELLVVFAEHAQRVLSQHQLLGLTSGRPAAPFERSIDVKVGRLRRKIESDPRSPALIQTVRGRGYRFAAPVTRL